MEGEEVRRVDRVYYRDLDALEGKSLHAKSETFQRKTAELVNKLRRFADEGWEISWTEEKTEQYLLSYVTRLSTPVLQASRFGSETPDFDEQEEHVDYIISAFVKRCLEKDEQGFKYLEDIAKGCMMANVVYYEDPGLAAEKFDGVTFYLDTPFLLDAVGVNGNDFQKARTELIDLLLEAGAELRVFSATLDESRRVIDAVAQKPESERQRRIPTANSPIQSLLSSSDLKMLSEKFADKLRGMRIRIEEKPDFERWLSLDEGDLENRLIKAGYNENKPDTIRHDVEALMAIHRLRKGRTPGRLENCTAAFVTKNSALCRVGTEFFADQVGPAARDAPPCVLNDNLATRVWLKMPNEAPDLPRKQLLAHSYAALLPDDDLLEKYLRKIEEMKEEGQVDEEDYIYLRSLKDMGRIVADVTLNDEMALTEPSVEEIRRRKEEEVQAQAVEAEERAERAEERRREEEAKRAEYEQRAAQAERRADREERRRHQREQRDRKRAYRVGWWTEKVIWGLLVVSLVAGVWIALPELPSNEASNLKKFGVGVLLILGGLGGVINALVTSNSVARWIGNLAERQVLGFLQPELSVDRDDS